MKKTTVLILLLVVAALALAVRFLILPARAPKLAPIPTRQSQAAAPAVMATAPAVQRQFATVSPAATAAPTVKPGRKSGRTGELSSGDALSLEGVIPQDTPPPAKQTAATPRNQVGEGLTVEVTKVGKDWVEVSVELDPNSDLIAESLTGTYAGTGEVKEFKPSATKPVTVKGLAVCKPYIVSVNAQNDEGRLSIATASFRTEGCPKGDEQAKSGSSGSEGVGNSLGGVGQWILAHWYLFVLAALVWFGWGPLSERWVFLPEPPWWWGTPLTQARQVAG